MASNKNMRKNIKQKYKISSLLEIPIGKTFISASDYNKCGCICKKVDEKEYWSYFQIIKICKKGTKNHYEYEQGPYNETHVLFQSHDYPVIEL